MTLKYVQSVRAYKFRNQAPNKSPSRVNVLVQAKVDDKEEAVQESVDQLEVCVASIYEEVGCADAPQE